MGFWNGLSLRWRFLLLVGAMVLAIVILLSSLHTGQQRSALSSLQQKVGTLAGDVRTQQSAAFDELVKEQDRAIDESLKAKAASLARLMTKSANVGLVSFDTEVLFSTLDEHADTPVMFSGGAQNRHKLPLAVFLRFSGNYIPQAAHKPPFPFGPYIELIV